MKAELSMALSVAPALLAGCSGQVSEPLFPTVERAEVVPGQVRVDSGEDETTDSATDSGGVDTGPFTGGCLEFHGDPDYFAGADGALPLEDRARTVEFWFKHNNLAGTDAVVAWGASGASFVVGFYNGFPMVAVAGSPVYGSSSAIADGSWHHLAAVWDPVAGAISLWIDGALDAQQAASVQTASGGVFWLGDDPLSPNSGDAYEGVIDEVHIWNKVLREGEFGGLFETAPDGMVAWYTMNQEGAGSGLSLPNQAGGAGGLDLVSGGAPAFVPCEY